MQLAFLIIFHYFSWQLRCVFHLSELVTEKFIKGESYCQGNLQFTYEARVAEHDNDQIHSNFFCSFAYKRSIRRVTDSKCIQSSNFQFCDNFLLDKNPNLGILTIDSIKKERKIRFINPIILRIHNIFVNNCIGLRDQDEGEQMYSFLSKNPLSIREIVSEHSVFVGTHKILLIFC